MTRDLTLSNLVYQEQRPVATSAYLEFANSFSGERIQSALEVPSVKAVSSLGLALSTAQSTYGANSDAGITSSITNVSAAPMDGSVHLSVAASDGTPVADLGTTPFAAVSVGGTLTVPATWNTGTMLAGNYQIHGTLLDKNGSVVDEASTVFAIVTPSAAISASLHTDKPVYQAWDSGSIASRIRNLAQNAVQSPGIAEIIVTRPNGTSLFTSTYNVSTLAMGSLTDRSIPLNLADASAGTYHVQLTVRDEFTHAVTAVASTTFDVQRDDLQALRGNVAVQSPQVDAGTSNICTDTITNVAHTTLSGAIIAQSVVSLDTGAVIQSAQQTLNFNGDQQQILLRNVATSALPQGAYACVLTATYQERTQQLGAAGFQVTAPPIRIDTQVSVGNHGRVLVLVDKPTSSKDAPDPYSGCDVPDLNVQLAHIKSALDETGWSYTIVQTAADFDREFHSGGYEVYAIFSEQVKLAVSLQDEVVNAVHNGAGLLLAGNHDRRNSKLEAALGIQSLGKNLSVSSLMLSASDVMPAGEEAISVDADVLELKLQGATAFGRYRLKYPKNNVETAAATTYAYGVGKSVYVGFDLIMAGAASGDDSLFAQLFTNALSYVHPEAITPIATHVLPLQIALTNQGVPTSGRVLLTVPGGVTLVDQGDATVLSDGTLEWSYSLTANQTLNLPTLYVKLPAQLGDINFHVQIQTGTGPDFVDYGETVLTVRVVQIQ
ncbi:MAG TPA: hypothetical protein VFS47_05420 [Steroidobacteraceae bacterium]|nr:hypothetical protein [Steroidobacteraceae bacterium]